MAKKENQLGMNPSTASHRLRTDILFAFVEAMNLKCFRCGGELTRDTFSIDHIVPWLDSENPKELFFDIDNIAFSHKACNYGDARKPVRKPLEHGTIWSYQKGCRCLECREAKSIDNKKRIR